MADIDYVYDSGGKLRPRESVDDYVYDKNGKPRPKRPKMLPETQREFLEGFAGLFNSEKYSDVTLFLGPEGLRFRAHYAVLGVRTTYFDKAKQHGFKEGETNEYRFPEYSAHTFWRVLQYFYSGVYSSEPNQLEDSGDDDPELVKHPRVYAIADFLDLGGLQNLCATKFEEQLKEHWISDTFGDAVREVYSTTYSADRAMKDPLVKAARSHIDELHQRPDFVKVLKEVAEFSGDLVGALVST